MSTNRITQGPWIVGQARDDYFVMSKDDEVLPPIASGIRRLANARLIAKAPEMLGALRLARLLLVIEGYAQGDNATFLAITDLLCEIDGGAEAADARAGKAPQPSEEVLEVDEDGFVHPQETELSKELSTVLNRHSAENGSDTPDFILAHYLLRCLAAFDAAVSTRTRWYATRDWERK